MRSTYIDDTQPRGAARPASKQWFFVKSETCPCTRTTRPLGLNSVTAAEGFYALDHAPVIGTRLCSLNLSNFSRSHSHLQLLLTRTDLEVWL
jgi:hypothetical protein